MESPITATWSPCCKAGLSATAGERKQDNATTKKAANVTTRLIVNLLAMFR
jgi:hypothetical protein